MSAITRLPHRRSQTHRRAHPSRMAAGRSSSAASCAIGCWAALEGPRPRSVRRSAGAAAGRRSAQLGRVEAVGQAFPVFKLGAIDVALPRRESKSGRGHKGFVVEGDPSMPVEEAARRRDFTINAIAWDPLTDEYLDPFNGRADLERRVLRVVDPRSLRRRLAARAARAAVRGPLRADARARRARAHLPRDSRSTTCRRSASGASSRSCCCVAERPSIGFALARELGVIEQLLPEMVPLYDCPQDPEWHPGRRRLDAHAHGDRRGAAAKRRTSTRAPLAVVMLGAVCHDLGKPATTVHVDGRIKSPGHEAAGVEPATARPRSAEHPLARRLRRPRAGAGPRRRAPAPERVLQGTGRRSRDGAFRRLAQRVDLELLTRFAARTATGARARSIARRWTGSSSAPARWAWSIARRSPILMGRHLLGMGVTPGPRMGEILKAVYEQQLDGEVTTLDEARGR